MTFFINTFLHALTLAAKHNTLPLLTLIISIYLFLSPLPLGTLLGLPIDLILYLVPLPLTLSLQLLLQRLELFALGVHAHKTLEQLDLVGPDLLVLCRLAIGAGLVDGRLENHGHTGEGFVVHYAVEGAETEETGSDVGVKVAFGVYGGFAVVDCVSG